MRMWEQVDRTENRLTYSWMLDAPYRHKKILPDWKWISGKPGCFVTNDKELAIKTAQELNAVIQSNGTHQTCQAEPMLAQP